MGQTVTQAVGMVFRDAYPADQPRRKAGQPGAVSINALGLQRPVAHQALGADNRRYVRLQLVSAA
jgi:hypothetical protein